MVRCVTGDETVSVQRFRCKHCGKTFGILPKHVDKYQRYDRLMHRLVLAAKQVLNGCLRKIMEFLRDIGVVLKKSTVESWLLKYGKKAGGLLDKIKPEFSGFLAIDEVWVRLFRKRNWNYGLLAVDKLTGVILGLKHSKTRTEEDWEKYLASLSWLLQPKVKLVSFDLLEDIYPPAIRKALGEDVKLQPCIFHTQKTIGKHLWDAKVAEEIRETIRKEFSICFRQKKPEDAEKFLDEAVLELESLGSKQSLDLIKLWRKDLFNYMDYTELGVSGTNNEAEHKFSFYKPNYKPMKAYQSEDSIQPHFDLVVWHLNNRPFERGKNAGKSPYELAGLPKLNWLDGLGLEL